MGKGVQETKEETVRSGEHHEEEAAGQCDPEGGCLADLDKEVGEGLGGGDRQNLHLDL